MSIEKAISLLGGPDKAREFIASIRLFVGTSPTMPMNAVLDLAIAGLDLEEALDLLRYSADWRKEPRSDIARKNALLARHGMEWPGDADAEEAGQ